MRVLLLCAAGIVSGKEIMSLHLLREMKSRGHTPFCAVSSWGSNDFLQRLREAGVEHGRLRMGFISKTFNWSAIRMTLVQMLYLPSLWIQYVRIVRSFKPDVIVHTNFHHVFLLYPFLDKSLTWYWSHEVTGNSDFYRHLFRLFEFRLTGFIGVSQVVVKSLQRILVSKPVFVINNGILVPDNNSQVKRRLDSSVLVLGIVGQVSPHKGHAVLIKALSQLKLVNWKLRIFGKGTPDDEGFLRKTIVDSGLSENCEWMGFVKDTNEIYRSIDVLVVPSLFQDPFPTTVMEAGVRAIPVVGSTAGGIPEMVKEGVNGFLFDSGNADDLTLVLQKVIKWEVTDDWSDHCKAYARERFGMERFANIFIETITQKHGSR
jgi:glycosyltransferase involved in cell wall biosynthesis